VKFACLSAHVAITFAFRELKAKLQPGLLTPFVRPAQRKKKPPWERWCFLIACVVRLVGHASHSPSTKASSSLSFVWAPAHSFFLLKKHHSAVRFQHASKAVCLLKRTNKKGA